MKIKEYINYNMNFFFDKIINVKDNPITESIQSSIAIVITAGLIALVYFLNIPNPNLILFTGLIALTSTFGFIPGAFALVGVYVYTLLFFSTNHLFVDFTEQNAIKTAVSFITSTMCFTFVGTLNHWFKKSILIMLQTNSELKNEKKSLEQISLKDELTDIKNRHSLRIDFPSYVGQEIHLMIFDVDEFKHFNDTYGHSIGDEVLKVVGSKTKEIFGEKSVYRFGGDEFVVIAKEDTFINFKEKIQTLMKEVEHMTIEDNELIIHLSVGFTYGVPTDNGDLRQMIDFADQLLYEVKKSGKNNLIGKRYELDLMDN